MVPCLSAYRGTWREVSTRRYNLYDIARIVPSFGDIYRRLHFPVIALAGSIPVLRPAFGVRIAGCRSRHSLLILPLPIHLELPRRMAWLEHPRQGHALWITHPSRLGYVVDLGCDPRPLFDAQSHHYPGVCHPDSCGQSRAPHSWICRAGINGRVDVDVACNVSTRLPRWPSRKPFLSGPIRNRRIELVARSLLYYNVFVDTSDDLWPSEIRHIRDSFPVVLPSAGYLCSNVIDDRSGGVDTCGDYVVWNHCSVHGPELTGPHTTPHLPSTLDDALERGNVLSDSDSHRHLDQSSYVNLCIDTLTTIGSQRTRSVTNALPGSL